MKKISITLKKNEFQKSDITEIFENITYTQKEENWEIEIFTKNFNRDIKIVKNLFKNNIKTIKDLKNINWVKNYQKNDLGVETEFFFFSQNTKTQNKRKKFKITLPNSKAFGTGKHESTHLAIKNIESIAKKKKIHQSCDIGTGSGILSFVLKKLTMKKVVATDIDDQSESVFYENKHNNSLNGIQFFRCDGLRSKKLMKMKFDLIVVNIYLNPLKRMGKELSKNIKFGGFLIVSGILDSQKNDLINFFNKINLTLTKTICLRDWVSLIFIKKKIK